MSPATWMVPRLQRLTKRGAGTRQAEGVRGSVVDGVAEIGQGGDGHAAERFEGAPDTSHAAGLVQRGEVKSVGGQVPRVEPDGTDVGQPRCAIRLRRARKAGARARRGSIQALQVDVNQQVVDVGAETEAPCPSRSTARKRRSVQRVAPFSLITCSQRVTAFSMTVSVATARSRSPT